MAVDATKTVLRQHVRHDSLRFRAHLLQQLRPHDVAHADEPIALDEPRGTLFETLPSSFTVGRYHSLYSKLSVHPKELRVTATTEDGSPTVGAVAIDAAHSARMQLNLALCAQRPELAWSWL